MSVLSQPEWSGPSPEHEGFRTAPWFILRDPCIKSNGLALVLSTVWAAIQSAGLHQTTTQIRNQEIADRSGVRGGQEEVRRYLVIAEERGFIRRRGNHRNRTIELLLAPPDDGDMRSLVIPPDILNSDNSPTEKLLMAIRRAFPKAKADWICRHLEISKVDLSYQV